MYQEKPNWVEALVLAWILGASRNLPAWRTHDGAEYEIQEYLRTHHWPFHPVYLPPVRVGGEVRMGCVLLLKRQA